MPALGSGNIDRCIYSAVSRDSGKTMNQLSDLRLGARLLCTATLFVCIVSSLAALLPVLRGKSCFAVTGTHKSDSVPRPVQAGQKGFNDFQTVAGPSQPKKKHVHDTGPDAATRRPPVTQMIARVCTVEAAAHDSDSQQSSPALPLPRVHVPVNVHPVTVNVDGSGFADQLSRLANGIDGILAAQQDALPRHMALSASESLRKTSQNMQNHGADLLTQIDANLRELSKTVESLRTESRTAVTQLKQEFKQVELTSELVEEFRLTLAGHRKILDDPDYTSPEPTSRNAMVGGLSLKIRCTPPDATPGTEQKPDPGTASSSGENQDIVVQQSTETELESAVQDESKDPVTSDVQNSAAQIEAEDHTPDTRTLFFPFIRQEDDRPVAESSKEGPAIQSETVIPRRTPTAFKRTFSFAMPPTNSLDPDVGSTAPEKPEQTESSRPMSREKSTAPLTAFPDGSGSQFSTPAAVTQKVNSSAATGSRSSRRQLNPRFVFPKQTMSRPTRSQPSSMQSRMARGVKAVQDLSGNGRNLVSEMTQSRPRHPRFPAPSRMKHPTILHRLGASIRSVGRVRTVE